MIYLSVGSKKILFKMGNKILLVIYHPIYGESQMSNIRQIVQLFGIVPY